MKEFILMCGLSGSGKSSYVERYIKNNANDSTKIQVLSSDKVREDEFGDVNDQSHNALVFGFIHHSIIEWAKTSSTENDILILDATNITRKHRMHILDMVKRRKSDYDIICTAVIIATPYERCVQNDAMRERTVGRPVIFKQLCRFSMPQPYEGWDNIEVIRNQGADWHNSYEVMEKMIGFNQNNPHHAYTLFEHCMKARYIAEAKRYSRDTVLAAQYHDIGKLFTRTTDECGISHYYNHANVST